MDLPEDWALHLEEETSKQYYQDLQLFVDEAYSNGVCYPPKEVVFSAFDQCSFDDVKVVILGQDPYHGLGQANGLCFSVADGIKFPPSLVNIFKELESDLALPIPISGNLERWAQQGVFLLNATLTVSEGKAGSHQKRGWETFTDAVIQKISQEKSKVVFLLWGAYAHKKGKMIDRSKHFVLEAGHPSPLSANRGYWFGNSHFSKTNGYLKEHYQQSIDW